MPTYGDGVSERDVRRRRCPADRVVVTNRMQAWKYLPGALHPDVGCSVKTLYNKLNRYAQAAGAT